ncbi:MAG: hypothetical protein OXM61_09325 [Candidatus Poribacteria bacterium]|nr:hypothetical protein [Candidatus Poribacteria bacterium]
MKTNLMPCSSLLAFVMVMLLLSLPLTTLAQQIPAEGQAKQDAEANLNKELWMGTGCAFPLLTTLGLVAGSFGPQSSRSSLFSGPQACGFCVGLTSAYLGRHVLIRRHQPTPPPERLLGKSPEYIAVYTDVYKKRSRQLRGQYIDRGYLIGCVVSGMLAIVINELFFENSE